MLFIFLFYNRKNETSPQWRLQGIIYFEKLYAGAPNLEWKFSKMFCERNITCSTRCSSSKPPITEKKLKRWLFSEWMSLGRQSRESFGEIVIFKSSRRGIRKRNNQYHQSKKIFIIIWFLILINPPFLKPRATSYIGRIWPYVVII